MTTSPASPLTVNCPHCQKAVVWNSDSTWRPFCSKRCHLIDLGAWANEDHRIAGEPAMDNIDIDALMAGIER
ncbi:DNA gyrase inhibitor YacG [Larsenimonas rhizosphaerae]|uniref:DNA gyrase inhibitor YacG n=1 Tax=Larsenimonas rhizosphaerae TaxID=2944682 RepID=A0AA41ZF98_9GAMM|nr:DNA gyrase inhibitor YacG [Larsenimonas rhizosphaerae]MCM2131032.1 DNA gyrase inhibitor YacG [Larsenimonas rhizosphaerae]MCX2523737.1 DNA gyrase inhibitor YacG [Larsenimonas rhizosphaerae]